MRRRSARCAACTLLSQLIMIHHHCYYYPYKHGGWQKIEKRNRTYGKENEENTAACRNNSCSVNVRVRTAAPPRACCADRLLLCLAGRNARNERCIKKIPRTSGETRGPTAIGQISYGAVAQASRGASQRPSSPSTTTTRLSAPSCVGNAISRRRSMCACPHSGPVNVAQHA